jgi:hypothetical protein
MMDNTNIIDFTSIQRKKVAPIEDKPKKEQFEFPAMYDIPNSPKLPKMPKKDLTPKQVEIQETESDPYGKQKMIPLLNAYISEFPEQLESFKGMKFEKKNLKELQDIRKLMDQTISSKSAFKQTQVMVTAGLRSLETTLNKLTPLKVDGLANTMLSDPSVIDDIKLVALKRMDMLQVEPETRLLIKLGSNIAMLHSINSKSLSQTNNKPKLDKLNEINQKFNGL